VTNLYPALNIDEIYFGPQGFKLLNDLADRKAFTEEFSGRTEQPHWNANWEVIAIDTELGDPYIIDKKVNDSPVSTAIFTGEEWELILVTDSVKSFSQCLEELHRVHPQQEPQFVPDETSFPNNQQLTTLTNKLITLSVCQEFWQNFSDCYIDWLEE